MKRLLYLIPVLLVFMGCATLDFSTNKTARKMAAIELGYRISKNNPTLAKQALPYAQGLLTMATEGSLAQGQIDEAVTLLANYIGDDDPVLPMLITDITTEMSGKLKASETNKDAVTLLQSFISGIKAGTK
ncbi:MAG: hypothetical protein HY739_13000 [Desulfobacterales bacterium]|nr:hypothetical protein [Desulfobacterales bacterium]